MLYIYCSVLMKLQVALVTLVSDYNSGFSFLSQKKYISHPTNSN